MKCYSCKGGTLENSTTSDFNDLGNCMIIVKDVPCQKCLQCGEIVFNFKTGERIEEIVDMLKQSLTEEIAVVQYSPTEIKVVRYAESIAA